ncbi:MAG: indole-3-glycerol phosphate synthase TrpC [Deltaproteobacteria bacterium]|nr:indole-3-glycerol phosphate synthase TrpC [Deltaproteobacteria bacterium]
MILERIVQHKMEEVSRNKTVLSLRELGRRISGTKPDCDFKAAIDAGDVAIIAEIKRSSPSRGRIREDFDHVAIARTYERNGVAAVSVITDRRFFEGDASFLSDIRKETAIPLLRKDFVIDPYQIYETVFLGGDAVLLIARILEFQQLRDFIELSSEMGLATLVEIHDEADLEKAVSAGARIIGINNRDLSTFETNLETSIQLAPLVPGGITIVSESGIRSRKDIERLMQADIRVFLVGETLMSEGDISWKIRELTGKE